MNSLQHNYNSNFPNIQAGYVYIGINQNESIFCTVKESFEYKSYFNIEIISVENQCSINTKKPVSAEFVKYSFNSYLKELNSNHQLFKWDCKEQEPIKSTISKTSRKLVSVEKLQDIVYFVSAGDFIKIGKSTGNPKARIQTLQTGCPYKIEVIGWINGDVCLEKELHQRFSKHKAHGEWFKNHSDITDYLTKESA